MRRGPQVDLTGIDDAALADINAIRVKEIHIAADQTVLVGVQQPVNSGLLVMDKVDQIVGAVGQVQIDLIAPMDIKHREGVQPRRTLNGLGAHIRDIAAHT